MRLNPHDRSDTQAPFRNRYSKSAETENTIGFRKETADRAQKVRTMYKRETIMRFSPQKSWKEKARACVWKNTG